MNCPKCDSTETEIHHPYFHCFKCDYRFALSYKMGKNTDLTKRRKGIAE